MAVISNREAQVLDYVAEGWTNQQIADELALSVDTVRSHLARVSKRLGATNRAHAVLLALRAGVIK